MRKSTGSEQRQRIMISQEADRIIREDSINFLGSENISGCINRIIRNARELSSASISLTAEMKEASYRRVLDQIPVSRLSEDLRREVIGFLVKHDIDESRKKLQSYPKEIAHNIRLQKDVFNYLYQDETWPEADYYPSQGAYIKALVEDYAAMPIYEREEIFYRDLLDILNAAILRPRGEERILRIRYMTASNAKVDCNIKPYAISTDQARQYHYLIALSRPVESKEKKYLPATFRVSRIDEDSFYTHEKTYGSGKITDEESKQIRRILKERGPQFLLDSEAVIRVHLTRNGINLFDSQYYMRPAGSCISNIEKQEDGSAIYTFRCTRRQIEYYFFKFGKEAVVLDPLDLAESIHSKYDDAAMAYKKMIIQ